MNIKKQLKEQRRKIDEKILSDGKQAYNELAGQYCVAETEPKQTRRINPTKWIAAVSCVVVVCLIVGLSVGLTQPSNPDTPPRPSEPSPPPEYLFQNEKGESCTFEDIKLATNEAISLGENYIAPNSGRIYDSESSDTLYYYVDFEHKEELIYGELCVVVNDYYEYPNRHLGSINQAQLNGYSVEYSVQKVYIEGIPTINYFGCIIYQDYKIYFSIQQNALLSERKKHNVSL